jgi:RimJ/RimL family protein N-acetyltransferase
MTGVPLETERLLLRGFEGTDDDCRFLFELDSDPEVMRYLGPYRMPNVEAYRERFQTKWLPFYTDPAHGFWAAIEEETGEFAGWFFLRPSNDYLYAKEAGWHRPTDLEVGYRLRRAVWGRGLATEASTLLVRRGLAEPDTTSIVSSTLVTNRRSWRVMEKVGMQRIREFTIPVCEDAAVMYAICKNGCEPPVSPELAR